LIFFLLCIIGSVFLFVYSLGVGHFDCGILEAFDIIGKSLRGEELARQTKHIIWYGRTPSGLMAIAAGAILAAGGGVMQTLLRNPLADPYSMGISSGALFGVSIAVIMGISIYDSSQSYAVILNAFVFALVPMAIILMASRRGDMTPSKIILTGIAVMFVFSAFSTTLMLTTDSETLATVYSWRVGTLDGISWASLGIVSVVGVIGISFLLTQARKYNVMTAGDNSAKSMGVDPKRTTLVGMTVISLMTATVVCFTGTIGFVGLVGPHIARLFVGSESKFLIPAAAGFGGIFLLASSCVARVSGPLGLPVGVISAMVGCPLFIIILVKMRSNVWGSGV